MDKVFIIMVAVMLGVFIGTIYAISLAYDEVQCGKSNERLLDDRIGSSITNHSGMLVISNIRTYVL